MVSGGAARRGGQAPACSQPLPGGAAEACRSRVARSAITRDAVGALYLGEAAPQAAQHPRTPPTETAEEPSSRHTLPVPARQWVHHTGCPVSGSKRASSVQQRSTATQSPQQDPISRQDHPVLHTELRTPSLPGVQTEEVTGSIPVSPTTVYEPPRRSLPTRAYGSPGPRACSGSAATSRLSARSCASRSSSEEEPYAPRTAPSRSVCRVRSRLFPGCRKVSY